MIYGILFSLLIGLFFLIGLFINQKNEKFNNFSYSLAFIVMLGLILFDLLPEINFYEHLYLLIFSLLGLLGLVILDKFIPDHHHEHHANNDNILEHNNHLSHIGRITIIALIIHNLIEGLSLFSVTLNNVETGFLMMLSISLHNIPLSLQISNSIDKKKNKILLILLIFSSLFGALVMIMFGDISEIIESILLSITLGMLIYILLFELLHEIKNSLTKKETLYGIIVGVILLIITYCLID